MSADLLQEREYRRLASMQDRALGYAVKATKKLLIDYATEDVDWPPHLTDLNPIETLCMEAHEAVIDASGKFTEY